MFGTQKVRMPWRIAIESSEIRDGKKLHRCKFDLFWQLFHAFLILQLASLVKMYVSNHPMAMEFTGARKIHVLTRGR